MPLGFPTLSLLYGAILLRTLIFERFLTVLGELREEKRLDTLWGVILNLKGFSRN